MSATALPALSQPARDPQVAAALGRRRRLSNRIATALCLLATAIGLFFLASILLTLVWRGIGGLNLSVFTQVTKPPGSNGGLLNAIVGSLIQTALGTLIGTPIGMMVGTYLSEYAGASRLGTAVRFVSDVLLSAPSILIGLFVYLILVNPFNGFSGIAGAVALAVIVIPIVVRTTEDMLRLIPIQLREAAVALGAPKWKSIVFICYPRRARRHRDRNLAGNRPRGRGNRAAAVHVTRQPELVLGPDQADEQPARHHLPVRRIGVPGLGAAGLGRIAAGHLRRAGHQHPGAGPAAPARLGGECAP